MVTASGRRIGARSRLRCGNLCDSDGTLDSNVDPTDPGSDPTAGDGDTGIGISLGVSLTL